MARHVLEAGHELTVWNRTAARAEELVVAGARAAADPAEAVAGADVVVLVLFGPDTDREILTGGVVAAAPRGCVVVELRSR